jgi:RHS repeat-associated protein
VTDDTGALVERYRYDDFGTPNITSSVGNPYMWNGRRFDPETGLYYYRTRYLEPRTGRFTSRDVIGLWGDPGNLGNGLAYVGNDPWSNVDPYGLRMTRIPPPPPPAAHPGANSWRSTSIDDTGSNAPRPPARPSGPRPRWGGGINETSVNGEGMIIGDDGKTPGGSADQPGNDADCEVGSGNSWWDLLKNLWPLEVPVLGATLTFLDKLANTNIGHSILGSLGWLKERFWTRPVLGGAGGLGLAARKGIGHLWGATRTWGPRALRFAGRMSPYGLAIWLAWEAWQTAKECDLEPVPYHYDPNLPPWHPQNGWFPPEPRPSGRPIWAEELEGGADTLHRRQL